VCGLIDRFPEIAAPLLELVRACARDGAGIRIDSVEELLQYSEGVAGTVGLMMYPLLGGRESAGRRHAEALGVAMQCTNIARDVLSDLRNGRVYLPGVRLERPEVDELFEGLGGAVEQRVVAAIQGVLEVASERYSFGLEGLGYLRSDCRRAIEIAARCYAAIGGRVVCGGRLVRRRAVVPLVSKLGIALQVYLGSPSAASGSLAFPK
jgi:phytoene synthase